MRIRVEKIKKVDVNKKLNGSVKYIDDTFYDDMIHGGFLYSSKAHAKIKEINFPKGFDLSEFTIVDYTDIPGDNIVENPVMDQPLFAAEKVNYIGQPILGVAHSKKEKMKRFIEQIEVKYQELEAIETIKDCLDNEENAILCPKEDIGSSFKSEIFINNQKAKTIDSNWIKHSGVYYTPHQEQLYIEPQGVYAKYEKSTRTIYVRSACQCPFYVHEAIEIFFKDAINRVEVQFVDALGGAFGGKEDYPNILAGISSLLAYKSGKGVKLILEREDDIQITTKRHPSRTEIVSYTNPKTKRIEKLDIDYRLDAGAYQTHSPVVLARGTLHAAGVINCSNVKVHGRLFRSNTPPNGAYRGFGAPQSLFAIESHIEEIAKKLNISSLEMRRINILKKGDFFPTLQKVDVNSPSQVLERAVEVSSYEKKVTEFKKFNKTNKIQKGIGLSVVMHGGGFTGRGEQVLNSKVRVNIDKKGIVRIYVSSTDMGQGISTTLPQCFCQAIGHPLEKTIYQYPNTQKTPNSGPTVASRTIYIVGNLLIALAKDIKQELGFDNLDKYITKHQSEFPRDFYKTFKMPKGVDFVVEKYLGTAYRDYSWAACVSEIEYDPDTYSISVKKLWNILDIGKCVNLSICEGQIQGGVIQAMGYATTEYMERASLKGKSITDYIAPTSLDVPDIFVEFINQDNSIPKGLGEIPMDFPAPAIRNAFYNATGIFLNEIPLLPESIFESINNR